MRSHDLNRLLDEPGQANTACHIYSENIFPSFTCRRGYGVNPYSLVLAIQAVIATTAVRKSTILGGQRSRFGLFLAAGLWGQVLQANIQGSRENIMLECKT